MFLALMGENSQTWSGEMCLSPEEIPDVLPGTKYLAYSNYYKEFAAPLQLGPSSSYQTARRSLDRACGNSSNSTVSFASPVCVKIGLRN